MHTGSGHAVAYVLDMSKAVHLLAVCVWNFHQDIGEGSTTVPSYCNIWGDPENTHFRWYEISMMSFRTLLARRLILFRWKDPAPPVYSHLVREVMCHLKLEKIRYTVRETTGKLYRIWQPFLFFVRDMDADSIVM